ncbi:cysteine desulfurase family protein [Rarobacter faecitabidus]|uniref:Cysteine desulfurase n=1 Tax=Rarobacter faecitabidus TaxID=13243 RepID=A0A542ZWZ4_RARFA|nr:cysteine desulfurase family protein [Rarobacter faecitabidus]TQL64868.1 cysteine desulfurase [Rarobacter faecitabidus]
MTPTYLDHAATTPMRRAAIEAYAEAATLAGNASSQHAQGRRARRVVEESREQIAALLGSRPSEIIFTSGGTEADNLAIKGVFLAQAQRGRKRVVISAVEHHAVLDPARWLQVHEGGEVTISPVDAAGRLDLDEFAATLRASSERTAVVSVMWANNETGTIQPIPAVVDLASRYGVPVHSDAVQAIGTQPVDFGASGLSAMTVGAHKVGGPVGVGALVARRDLPLTELTSGGGQERSVRSGTLDVAGVRAFAVALEETVRERAAEAERVAALRDRLIAGVREQVSGAQLRGVDPATDPTGRLASIANFTFAGCEGDSLLFSLDSRGICASTGSACQAGVPQASHVLLAMGIDEDTARGALRFSLGHTSTEQDVDELLAVLPEAVARARSAGLTTRANKPLTAVES